MSFFINDKEYLLQQGQISAHHHFQRLHVTNESYLLTWFDRKLENILADLWFSSPSAAFALHEQMNQQILSTLQNQLPEICTHGCAPLPACKPELNRILRDFDIQQNKNGQLDQIYAVLTFWPWKGGCTACSLKNSCVAQGLAKCS